MGKQLKGEVLLHKSSPAGFSASDWWVQSRDWGQGVLVVTFIPEGRALDWPSLLSP